MAPGLVPAVNTPYPSGSPVPRVHISRSWNTPWLVGLFLQWWHPESAARADGAVCEVLNRDGLRQLKAGDHIGEPAIQLNEADARSLCEALIQEGYAPEGYERSPEERKATDAHLQDMRRLVFDPKKRGV